MLHKFTKHQKDYLNLCYILFHLVTSNYSCWTSSHSNTIPTAAICGHLRPWPKIPLNLADLAVRIRWTPVDTGGRWASAVTKGLQGWPELAMPVARSPWDNKHQASPNTSRYKSYEDYFCWFLKSVLCVLLCIDMLWDFDNSRCHLGVKLPCGSTESSVIGSSASRCIKEHPDAATGWEWCCKVTHVDAEVVTLSSRKLPVTSFMRHRLQPGLKVVNDILSYCITTQQPLSASSTFLSCLLGLQRRASYSFTVSHFF